VFTVSQNISNFYNMSSPNAIAPIDTFVNKCVLKQSNFENALTIGDKEDRNCTARELGDFLFQVCLSFPLLLFHPFLISKIQATHHPSAVFKSKKDCVNTFVEAAVFLYNTVKEYKLGINTLPTIDEYFKKLSGRALLSPVDRKRKVLCFMHFRGTYPFTSTSLGSSFP
jgi:hypothetical protein